MGAFSQRSELLPMESRSSGTVQAHFALYWQSVAGRRLTTACSGGYFDLGVTMSG